MARNQIHRAESSPIRRIISILLEGADTSELQTRQGCQVNQTNLIWQIAGDFIGAISLFIILFGGMWMLPLIAEFVR